MSGFDPPSLTCSNATSEGNTMAFFLGIGGPWIVLMILDLFWTKQGLEHAPSGQPRGWQQRLERLLQRREGRPVPVQTRGPLLQTGGGEHELPQSSSYLFRTPD